MGTIVCGGCGASLDVGALAPGTAFACGGCGKMLQAPAAAVPVTAPPPEPAVPAAPPAARPSRADRKSRSASPAAAPGTPRHSRRREKPAGEAGPAGGKPPLLLVGGIAGVLLLGGGLVYALGGSKAREDSGETDDRPSLGAKGDGGTAAATAAKGTAETEENLSSEEKEWRAAKSDAARREFVTGKLTLAKRSEEASRDLHAFLAEKRRSDLGRLVAEARLEMDPDSEWANGVLDRTSVKASLEELAANTELQADPGPEWTALKERLEAKRWWVGKGTEEREVEAALEAARARAKDLSDPWNREARSVVADIEGDATFKGFTPVDHIAFPPYLVMAQRQLDETRHNTKNVLENHAKLFKCLTTEFLRIMEEAGLPIRMSLSREFMGRSPW